MAGIHFMTCHYNVSIHSAMFFLYAGLHVTSSHVKIFALEGLAILRRFGYSVLLYLPKLPLWSEASPFREILA
jgi:hypothetical protein